VLAVGIISIFLAPFGCHGRALQHEFTLAPGQGHHVDHATAMLVPINESADVPVGLDVADDQLEDLLDEYVSEKGISIERPEEYEYRRAARIAVRRATQDAMSGESGTVSKTVGFEQIVPFMLDELGSEADLVIVPNLAMRTGIYNGGRGIRWDGVRRRETGSMLLNMSGPSPVASIFVVVYAKDGTRLFSGYGGLDTVFEVSLRQKKFVLREDRLTNVRYLKEGVCVAFYPYFGEDERC